MSLPKIKYVLIVLETKKILCEYKEDEIPNIQKVFKNILGNRVKPYETSSLNYDNNYTIFYKNDSLITILCATDINYPSSTAFEFLSVLINAFRSQYKEEEIRQAYSYSFSNSFKKTIKTKELSRKWRLLLRVPENPSGAIRISLTLHAHAALSRYRLFAICAAL